MSASDVEFRNQLVVVPRMCEWCLRHVAVFFWAGSWPDGYMCRECMHMWLPVLEVQPWCRPIGWFTGRKKEADSAPLASHVGPLASATPLPPTSTF